MNPEKPSCRRGQVQCLVRPSSSIPTALPTGGSRQPDEARPASGRQTDRHDAMLQTPEPVSQEQAEQAALRQEWEKAHRQPGREAIRPQKGLGLFPLGFLDGDDLWHPLGHNLPGVLAAPSLCAPGGHSAV